MTAVLYTTTLWPDALDDRRGAVLQAAEEIIAGTLGSVRTMPPIVAVGAAYDGATDEKMAADVVVQPLADVALLDYETTGTVAPETCDVAVDRITLRVRLAFTTATELDASLRRAVRALCWGGLEAIQDALAWPGNLTVTTDAVATGLVGGALVRKGPARVVREDWAKRIFVAEFQMTGHVQRTRAVA